MTRENRIKNYEFDVTDGNATTITQYSKWPLNGEILRINAFANFTGSVIVTESGTNLQLCNYSVTSGTNSWSNLNFSTGTGSFVINNIVKISVGSLVSGTENTFGPINIYYR
jgi:hypothetical protein